MPAVPCISQRRGKKEGRACSEIIFFIAIHIFFFSYFPSLLIFAVSTSFSEISSAVLASIRGRNSRCKQELRFGLRARGSTGRCRGPVNLATVSCKSDITHLSGVCVRGDKTFSYSLRLIHKLFFSV